MAKDVEEYSINELAVGAIKQLRRIADGIEAQNKMHQAYYDLRKNQEASGSKESEKIAISDEENGVKPIGLEGDKIPSLVAKVKAGSKK